MMISIRVPGTRVHRCVAYACEPILAPPADKSRKVYNFPPHLSNLVLIRIQSTGPGPIFLDFLSVREARVSFRITFLQPRESRNSSASRITFFSAVFSGQLVLPSPNRTCISLSYSSRRSAKRCMHCLFLLPVMCLLSLTCSQARLSIHLLMFWLKPSLSYCRPHLWSASPKTH